MTDNDSTKLMQPASQAYFLDEGLAQQAEACPHCQAQIAVGEQFCGICGYQRGTWEGIQADASLKEGATRDHSDAIYTLTGAAGTFYISAGKTVIGRGEVDIQVADGYMSRSHAELDASEELLRVKDLGSSNGSFIDGKQLEPEVPAELKAGQSVRFGQTEFTVGRVEPTANLEQDPDADDAASEDADAPAEAEVVAEDTLLDEQSRSEDETPATLSDWVLLFRGQSLGLPEGLTTFGRKPGQCDVVIQGDGYISGCHFSLQTLEDEIELCDLGSTNGTVFEGERLAKGQLIGLADGSGFTAGQTEFVLQLVDSEAEAVDELTEDDETAEPDLAGPDTESEST